MYKKIIFAFMLLYIIGLSYQASADPIFVVKQDTCVNLPQLEKDSAFQNISSIEYPNKTILYLNQPFTKNGNYYNYSFCGTQDTGTYLVNGCSDLSCWTYNFQVTQTGQALDVSKALLYITVFIISVLLFIGCLVFASILPKGNKKDEMTGYILSISSFKYAKIILYGAAYLILMLVMWLSFAISTSYLDMDFLGKLFYDAFYVMTVAMYPGFVLMIYFLIANAVRDHEIGEALSQNLRIKDDY